MLVIARKRHEAFTIDGNIRVEVLSLTGGLTRLRFVAPRRITIERGVARPGSPPAPEAVNGGIDATGMGAVDLTLADQQIITVRSDIHVGVVDVDSTRAVLFVDAPVGVAVNVETAPGARSRSRTGRPPSEAEAHDEAVQALLPFPPPADPTPADAALRKAPPAPAPAPILPFPGVAPEPQKGG